MVVTACQTEMCTRKKRELLLTPCLDVHKCVQRYAAQAFTLCTYRKTLEMTAERNTNHAFTLSSHLLSLPLVIKFMNPLQTDTEYSKHTKISSYSSNLIRSRLASKYHKGRDLQSITVSVRASRL
jgi:hypothetical protein